MFHPYSNYKDGTCILVQRASELQLKSLSWFRTIIQFHGRLVIIIMQGLDTLSLLNLLGLQLAHMLLYVVYKAKNTLTFCVFCAGIVDQQNDEK